MKPITDDELTLLYYGENEDPDLARLVAASEELSSRFADLGAELEIMDAWKPPEKPDDYGADVWLRISPELESHQGVVDSRLKNWWSGFSQPRFSMAGMLGIILVAGLAFMLGREGGQSPVSVSDENFTAMVGNLDTSRLLTSSVANHLQQVDLVLTQFANSTESTQREAEWATDMLVANRLYRKAASDRGEKKLAAFLVNLEPLLIELAFQAQNVSSETRQRMQAEVRNGLLFRVRVMNSQLRNTQIST